MENNNKRFMIELHKKQIMENLANSKMQAHEEIQKEIAFIKIPPNLKRNSTPLIDAIRWSTFRNRAAWALLAVFAAELFILSPILGINQFFAAIFALAIIPFSGFQIYLNQKVEKQYGAIVYKNVRSWLWPKFVRYIEYR